MWAAMGTWSTFESRGVLMGSQVARILGAVGAATLSVAMFGSGVASADALIGTTYSDAAAKVSSWGGKAVVGTVSGDQLETGDCLVTAWHKSHFLNSSGRNERSNEYVLHLSCNNLLASPGHPGNSSVTPAGIGAKQDQITADAINTDPTGCYKNNDNLAYCQAVCKRTGLCQV